MPKVEWSDGLSINIATFDEEHKKLVEMLSKLYDALALGKSQKVMPAILTELVNYTKTHFKNEEEHFQKNNYPGAVEHKKHHDDFIKRLNDVLEQHKNCDITLGIPVYNMLLSWLQTHIQKIDKAYAEFHNNLNVK